MLTTDDRRILTAAADMLDDCADGRDGAIDLADMHATAGAIRAIVYRPVPTPAPAPGLDLEAAEKRAAGFRGTFRVMSYDSSDEMLEYIDADHADHADLDGDDVDTIAQFACDDAVQRAIVDTLNAAPALIAEVRALRANSDAACAELERVHAELERSVDPGNAALVAERNALADTLARAVWPDRHVILSLPIVVGNAVGRLQRAAADLAASRSEVRTLRAKLAESKRLGLEAVALARDSIEVTRDTLTAPATSAIVAVGCLNVADRIAAALEAL